jgi:hypothetical protein
MIAQGTDGVSRGSLKQGVANGASMLSFVPLHQGAIERNPALLPWIQSWSDPGLELLTPEGWFTLGHGEDGGSYDSSGYWRTSHRRGIYLWVPAPAAAETCLNELRKAVIKGQESAHMIVIPCLLSSEWRKHLHKMSDLIVALQVKN